MPDKHGKIKGISVPHIPWHDESLKREQKEWEELQKLMEQPESRKLKERLKARHADEKELYDRLGGHDADR